ARSRPTGSAPAQCRPPVIERWPSQFGCQFSCWRGRNRGQNAVSEAGEIAPAVCRPAWISVSDWHLRSAPTHPPRDRASFLLESLGAVLRRQILVDKLFVRFLPRDFGH